MDTDMFVHPVWDSGPVVSVNDLVSVNDRVGERSLECANIYVQCSAQYCTVLHVTGIYLAVKCDREVYYGVVQCIVNYP